MRKSVQCHGLYVDLFGGKRAKFVLPSRIYTTFQYIKWLNNSLQQYKMQIYQQITIYDVRSWKLSRQANLLNKFLTKLGLDIA